MYRITPINEAEGNSNECKQPSQLGNEREWSLAAKEKKKGRRHATNVVTDAPNRALEGQSRAIETRERLKEKGSE